MNTEFQRGQKIKKTLKVGLNSATFDLEYILIIRYDKLPCRIRLKENASYSVLKEIQKNPKELYQRCHENKRAFGFVRSGEGDSQWVMEISGELVKFKNKLYSIPRL